MGEGVERVESWAQLREALYEGSWDERLRRHRSRRVFRGASVAGRGLRPGLSALGGEYAAKERHLLRNFRKYAHRSFRGDASLWNWLALAQHHGLPTRLLDWTSHRSWRCTSRRPTSRASLRTARCGRSIWWRPTASFAVRVTCGEAARPGPCVGSGRARPEAAP